MVCRFAFAFPICILGTNLSISVYVSDKVHLRSGSISNLFLFYFQIEKSEKVLSHRYIFHIYVLEKVQKYLIIKLKQMWIGYFHKNPQIS